MTDAFDVANITPEQFANLVAAADDDQILQVVHGVGTALVLGRVFDQFKARFQPDKAAGVEAVIQFVVTDAGDEHPYAVTIHDGACATEPGRSESPRVTLTMDLLSFLKLVGGQAEGPQLFMTGKLKVAGDMMFALRIMTFFDRPRAA